MAIKVKELSLLTLITSGSFDEAACCAADCFFFWLFFLPIVSTYPRTFSNLKYFILFYKIIIMGVLGFWGFGVLEFRMGVVIFRRGNQYFGGRP